MHFKIHRLHIVAKGRLSPFAFSHLEDLKGAAQEYVINVVGEDVYFVYLPGKEEMGHVVN